MTAKLEITLNRDGVRQLLKSSEIQSDLANRAARIAGAAAGIAGGGEFAHDTYMGANRARAMVWTEDHEARHAEATIRALTRAVDAGR